MTHEEYGTPDGSTVIYFHGAPGSAGESSIFDTAAKKNKIRMISLDRLATDANSGSGPYFRAIAREIVSISEQGPVDIVGFSIGAHVALMVSAELNVRVR